MSGPRTWLIFDVSNLAWRAHHSTGHLAHDGDPTGVLYGVLKEVRQCCAKFQTTDCVFCFDKGKSYRAEHFPWYKASRRNKKLTDEEEVKLQTCRDQIRQLEETYLPRLGFENVFSKTGYEADDLIASVCLNLPYPDKKTKVVTDRAVVVSGDQDLYQCVRRHRVKVYHPAQRDEVTFDKFQERYGLISPSRWNWVKAIAGCRSDDIPGVGGLVGEKTACCYLANKKDAISRRKWDHIAANLATVVARNLKLTTLPYPGTPVVDLVEDCKILPHLWDEVMGELGFDSMKDSNRGSWLPVRGPDKIKKEKR